MSYARASIVYGIDKLLEKIKKGVAKLKGPLGRIAATIVVAPVVIGQRTENAIIRFSNSLAQKINEAQRSLEESLTMASLYIGFLMTTAIVLATVVLYVAGH